MVGMGGEVELVAPTESRRPEADNFLPKVYTPQLIGRNYIKR